MAKLNLRTVRVLIGALSLGLGFGYLAFGLSLEHVSNLTVQDLRAEFAQGLNLGAEDVVKLANTRWACDMYGVRSRLQVERNVELYDLKIIQGKIENRGAQVVQNYQAVGGKTVGSKGPLRDQLKLNKKGQLISELSVTREGEKSVLAYSVCRNLSQSLAAQ